MSWDIKFKIEDGKSIERLLTYIPEEASFNMGDILDKIDVELILNKISLAVAENKVVHVSGFCGFKEWMKSNYEVPGYSKGVLEVEHDLKHGLAYGIYDEDLPVYVNTKTGWVCIGKPEKLGKGVEFINNCVAVIGDNGEFLSLWLKPPSLPKL